MGELLELCRELDRASRRPWVLLSAGISFELFKKEVEIACKAGASGFLAGRALWQEGAGISSRVERMDFFNDVAASRLKEISEIAAGYGRPWYEKAGFKNGEFGGVSEGWYESY